MSFLYVCYVLCLDLWAQLLAAFGTLTFGFGGEAEISVTKNTLVLLEATLCWLEFEYKYNNNSIDEQETQQTNKPKNKYNNNTTNGNQGLPGVVVVHLEARSRPSNPEC